jgi:hypothetical protein
MMAAISQIVGLPFFLETINVVNRKGAKFAKVKTIVFFVPVFEQQGKSLLYC